MDFWTQWGKERVGCMEKVGLTYTHSMGKQIAGEKLLFNTGSPAL